MNITLIRKIKLKDRTIGELSIDGKKFCDTIEDTERFSWIKGKLFGTKIFGKTAIPTGTYEVVLSYSARFKKVLPLLVNVPQYTGVRIHSGNTQEDTEGCIIVGKHDPKLNIIGYGTSKATLTKLMALLEPASKTGKIYITII